MLLHLSPNVNSDVNQTGATAVAFVEAGEGPGTCCYAAGEEGCVYLGSCMCVHGGQCCGSGHYTILWACLRMKPRSVQSPDLNSAQPILVPRRGQADITRTQGHTNRPTRTQTSLTHKNANVFMYIVHVTMF